MWKVTPKDDKPETAAAARVAEVFFNDPEFSADANAAAEEELERQLIYGLPPSEGIPDVRPKYPIKKEVRQRIADLYCKHISIERYFPLTAAKTQI